MCVFFFAENPNFHALKRKDKNFHHLTSHITSLARVWLVCACMFTFGLSGLACRVCKRIDLFIFKLVKKRKPIKQMWRNVNGSRTVWEMSRDCWGCFTETVSQGLWRKGTVLFQNTVFFLWYLYHFIKFKIDVQTYKFRWTKWLVDCYYLNF